MEQTYEFLHGLIIPCNIGIFCYYNNSMEIWFDETKRGKTLQEHGLDLARVREAFASVVVIIGYSRQD